MKAKTIKMILRKKVDEWVDSIEDEDLKKNVKENCIITGGSIASMLLNENINDYDVYFTNKETTKRVAEYYVEKFKSNPPSSFKNDKERLVDISVLEDNDRIKIVVKSQGVASEDGTEDYQYFESTSNTDPSSDIFIEHVTEILKSNEYVNRKQSEKNDYRPIFLSSNAITLSDNIQLIIRFYGSPEKIHENYDFVHCTNYWVSDTNSLTLKPEALEALLTKELIYIGSKYPIASVIRTRKFIQRGFSCNAGQYLKMCWQISELNLNDIKVLEDQLVGVDAAYFRILIDILKAKQADEEFKYNYSYIVELIDKIF